MVKTPEKFEGFDRVFPLIGGHHRYQWLLLCVVAMQACFFSFHHMGYVFLGAVPDHWCDIEEMFNLTNWTPEEIKNISIPTRLDSTNNYEKCEHYDLDFQILSSFESYEEALTTINYTMTGRKPCTRWKYDTSIYVSTTATQFNLVCDRKYLVATIQASYMSGVFIGSFLMGGLSDGALGRRRAVLFSVVLVIISGFGAAFSTSYAAFVIFRFFIAVGVAGSFQNCFTLLLEYSDTSYRALMGLIQQIPFAIGYMVMPLYAYFLRDWSHLQLAFVISTLTLLSYFWTLPESSRWLVSKGREAEALEILMGIAKRNKKPKPHHLEITVILESCKQQNSASNSEQRSVSSTSSLCSGILGFLGKYWSLVRTPELRRRSIILWFLFISVTLVYYGVSFDSALLTDDPFLLVFLGGLMEIPGYLGVSPFASRIGRTPTVGITFLLSGISSLLVAFTPFEYKAFRIIFAMAGKLFISGCFGVIYLLGTELYPTTTRATGLGSAVLMGRFGSILAPYVVNQMKTIYSDMPSIIFGVSAIIAGLVAFLLPETRNVEMMESVKAIETRSVIGQSQNDAEQATKFLTSNHSGAEDSEKCRKEMEH